MYQRASVVCLVADPALTHDSPKNEKRKNCPGKRGDKRKMRTDPLLALFLLSAAASVRALSLQSRGTCPGLDPWLFSVVVTGPLGGCPAAGEGGGSNALCSTAAAGSGLEVGAAGGGGSRAGCALTVTSRFSAKRHLSTYGWMGGSTWRFSPASPLPLQLERGLGF